MSRVAYKKQSEHTKGDKEVPRKGEPKAKKATFVKPSERKEKQDSEKEKSEKLPKKAPTAKQPHGEKPTKPGKQSRE